MVRTLLTRSPDLGQYAPLLDEHKEEDANGFFNFLRMGNQTYQDILIRIGDRIKLKKSKLREASVSWN
ncbi:hypothetical protein DPMN_173185 [Dreissena polymorpha]|uniref:Uncharacterized protein n=1 Tax=Dreissena polymorpha TaxID=45954 RepID=A0A9D4E278_DREPO|nr:hypothetical protein DPMN_173185 [Dreissena polymorpha]